MISSFLKKFNIPHSPGVYIFKNVAGKILYVGKALDLYHRISSYFSNSISHPGDMILKTKTLVKNISGIETIVVASEIEALILEANLIKKYLPPYNIKLTDDKDYLYIKVTKEAFPKIITARKNDLNDAKIYFGPFPSARIVKDTLKKLRHIFPWCSNPPKASFLDSYYTATGGGTIAKTRIHQCFYYHLHLCPGPCAGKISKKDYAKIIRRFIKFMEGKTGQLQREFNKEMKQHSNNMEFEFIPL